MFTQRHIFKLSLISSGLIFFTPVFALEKPKTIDEMWKIIEMQQRQIEALQQTKSLPEDIPTKSPFSQNTEVKNLERKTDVLSQEVEKLRTNLSIPEEPKYKSMYGLGPAASKVYQVGKGLSLGGYGEAMYSANVGDKGSSKDKADMERLVLYAGYKFTDKILFNSEMEFEHATTGEGAEERGEVSVEFAALDFFINPMANVRAGLVLMPMGFINQMHEPPFYFGNARPEVEQYIIPSTWREVGAGLFGQITPELSYTAYVVNGLNADGFETSGIREGRGGGSEARAENFGYVARLDYSPTYLTGVTVGGAAFVGNAGQNQQFGTNRNVKAFTQLYEAHLQWKYKGLEFRTLGSWGRIDDAGILSNAKGETIGSQNYGFYSEMGYDILPHLINGTDQYLAPFFRYEQYDTLASIPNCANCSYDGSTYRQIYQFGLQYKPIPNVVIKADYRNRNSKSTAISDDFNLGFGFIF